MESFKQFMGFTLIATTVWLVDVLGAQTGLEGAVGFLSFLVFVGIGCWIQGRWGSLIEPPKKQLQAFVVAVAISAIGGFLFLKSDFAEEKVASAEVSTELDFSKEIPWQAFSEARVAELKGELIFIDFTADWCLTCKVNEKSILETERVRSEMSKLGVVPLKADWTRRDETITKWLQRHGKAGVPLYLVISKEGAEVALPEVITPDMVIDLLKKSAG